MSDTVCKWCGLPSTICLRLACGKTQGLVADDLRAEVERLRGALRVMLDGCNEGVHHGPCADCEDRARAALEEGK